MALAVDGSAPIRFTGTPADNVDITSASFTPPAASLLLVGVSTNSNAVATLVSVSDSLGGTWTEEVRRNLTDAGFEGHASIWRRTTAVPNTSMTVSVRRTNSSGGSGAFNRVSAKAYVITGQHASPIPTTGENSSSTNNLTAALFVSAFAASLGLVVGTDWNANGLPTSSNLTIDAFDHSGVLSGLSGYRTLPNPVAQTANLDAAGAGAAEWNWVAVEIRQEVSGEFSGALLAAVSALAGTFDPVGGFSGTLSSGIADLDGAFFTSNEFTGALASAAATLSGVFDNSTTFAGTLSAALAELVADVAVLAPPDRHSNVRLRFTGDRRKYRLYLGPRR